MTYILECRTNHLAARMIWKKVFGRTSILVGRWFGMVRTRWSSIFLKHPLREVAIILFILFFKYLVWQGTESIPSPDNSDNLFLRFCLYPSYILVAHTILLLKYTVSLFNCLAPGLPDRSAEGRGSSRTLSKWRLQWPPSQTAPHHPGTPSLSCKMCYTPRGLYSFYIPSFFEPYHRIK